jgi:YcxB-like protein
MQSTSSTLLIEYQITEQVYVDASLAICRLSSASRKFCYYVLPVLGWLSVAYATFKTAQSVLDGCDLTEALRYTVGFYVAGVIWLILHFVRPWRLKRIYRKDPRFKKPVRIAIDGGEWQITTATAEARLKASAFLRAIETPSFYLFFVSSNMAQFVPKPQLTAEQLAGMNEYLDREFPVRKGDNRLPAPSQG